MSLVTRLLGVVTTFSTMPGTNTRRLTGEKTFHCRQCATLYLGYVCPKAIGLFTANPRFFLFFCVQEQQLDSATRLFFLFQ